MKKSSDSALLTKLYFHLLPYQVLLLVINAITGIVDSLWYVDFSAYHGIILFCRTFSDEVLLKEILTVRDFQYIEKRLSRSSLKIR